MEYSKQEIVDYYLATKRGMEDYETNDFLTILTSKVYTELPFIVTKVTFYCLIRYTSLHKMYNSTGYICDADWNYEMREPNTGKFICYTYDKPINIPFNMIERELCIAFLTHYIKMINEDYFTLVLTNSKDYEYKSNIVKKHYPLNVYRTYILGLAEVSYWYLGKKDTDRLMEDFREDFFTRLKGTEYAYTQENIEDKNTEIATEYRLMRNRTRLNTRKQIPEKYPERHKIG